MQCEIRAMGEIGEGARSARVSDTLPKPGRVNEVCKEWLVHEDGALAYQLQKEEVMALWVARKLENTLCRELSMLRLSVDRLRTQIFCQRQQLQMATEYSFDQHYTGNKSRNAIIREDLPKAKDEQKREEEEALAKYHQMVILQEEKDARVAKQLAERIEREEAERRRRLETEDKEIARQIQEREKLSVRSTVPLPLSVPVGDVNSVGLPLAEDIDHKLMHQLRGLKLQELTPSPSCTSSENWPPPPQPEQLLGYEKEEEEYRRLQEQKDEELARRLQEQEDGFESIDQLDKDRLMAIEAQDKELARLLQERERAKAKRARERAKQRALLKKQQQMQEAGHVIEGEEEIGEWTERSDELVPATRPTNLDLTNVARTTPTRSKQRYPDPEEIEVLSSTSPLPNIAMVIDPTYTPVRHGSNVTSPAISLPPPDFEEEDDGPVPPYMPIQGQRRTSSLEKKPKKTKPKDGCKQQ